MAESSTIVTSIDRGEDDVEEHCETSDQSVSDVDGKKYKSQVWKFFMKKGEKTVTCSINFVMLVWHITAAPALRYST